jgi:integrase
MEPEIITVIDEIVADDGPGTLADDLGLRPISPVRRRPPEPLTRDEAEALVDAPDPRYPTGCRNRALIAVLWRTGIRCAEVLDLRTRDYDPVSGVLRIRSGKGGKYRQIALDLACGDLLDRWIVVRREGWGRSEADGGYIFCTRTGERICNSYVRKLMPRMGKRAKIQKRVHAHGLRHTLASELAAERVPINIISKALGHSSSSTTSRYLDHISPQDVIDTMRQRTWRI